MTLGEFYYFFYVKSIRDLPTEMSGFYSKQFNNFLITHKDVMKLISDVFSLKDQRNYVAHGKKLWIKNK